MIRYTTTVDPDAAILERIRDGQTGLYEVLIKRYNQRLYRVARAILHDDTSVEDVMQEAYLKAFTALPRFQGKALFSTWLTRILINCALAHLRATARRQEVTLAAVETGAPTEEAPIDRGEMRLVQEQIGRLIEKTIDTLPAKYRVVFVMRELEDMSVAETAASLGISPVNAKVRLHRAKRLLREELRRQMPEISLYSFLGERCVRMTRRVMEAIMRASSPSVRLPGRKPVEHRGAYPPGA
ncbi:MAG TPA: RNA polymerase sigma factor [Spirochaetia bacterium]|nr:RNA polymerase sigma factor [Spirochaetia bacterium]